MHVGRDLDDGQMDERSEGGAAQPGATIRQATVSLKKILWRRNEIMTNCRARKIRAYRAEQDMHPPATANKAGCKP